MVQSKPRKVLYFAAFILPCLVLYMLFFIWPFFHGFYISLTNWDGLTPKSPIILSQEEFETQILGKIKKESDREYLLSVYTYNPVDNTYSRLAVSSLERIRVERILSSVGYEPPNNRFVGLGNYKKILTGQVSDSFYPHTYMQINYNKSSNLPSYIDKKAFEQEILAKASPAEREIFLQHYTPDGNRYRLNHEYDEFTIEDGLWYLDEVDNTKTVPETAIDALISAVKNAGIERNEAAKNAAVDTFRRTYPTQWTLSHPHLGSALRASAPYNRRPGRCISSVRSKYCFPKRGS